MATASIHDPRTLAAVYSREDHDRDAASNSDVGSTVRHGLRVLSAPDEAGNFVAEPATRHVGEESEDAFVAFVCPFRPALDAELVENDTAYGGPLETGRRPARRADRYLAFLDQVIEAARRLQPPAPAERTNPRLKGFRGG